MTAPARESPILIRPIVGWPPLRLERIWERRELVYFLVWRDLKVRYQQTVVGTAWAVLQPVLAMILFSVFFGWLAGMPADGLPYPVFAYAALVPWQFFAHVLGASVGSLVSNATLITKVSVPRLVIPLSVALADLVDLAASFSVLLLLMAYFRILPGPAVVLLPLFVLLALITAFGVGLWLCCLNVRFRDIAQATPFLTQLWLFATPVVYPASLVPEPWRPLLGLNPMAGAVEGFRWALLGVAPGPGPLVLVSGGVAMSILVGGLYWFRRMEGTLADDL